MLKNVQNVACIKFNDKVPLLTKLTLYLKKKLFDTKQGIAVKEQKTLHCDPL